VTLRLALKRGPKGGGKRPKTCTGGGGGGVGATPDHPEKNRRKMKNLFPGKTKMKRKNPQKTQSNAKRKNNLRGGRSLEGKREKVAKGKV